MVACGVRRDLPSLARSHFDVLVIGGGIVGAAAARDAALRGLAVALIERHDFGGGISWNSLKILHGGLRSLQGLELAQARQFVRERRAWLRIAPHLVDPLAFVVPTRGAGRESALLMRAGLVLNDLVSYDRNEGISLTRRLPSGRMLTRTELQLLVPDAPAAYTGAALFHDAQLYSADRLIIAVLEDAARTGAQIANYAEAGVPLLEGERLIGVQVTDRLTGETFDIRASMVINAAGAGAASIADRLTRRPAAAAPMTGIALNLMLADQGERTAFAIAAQEEGKLRRLFVVPWRGRTLVGTAHYPVARAPESSDELEPFVERFVREVAAAWPARSITRADVLLVHAGMQPAPHGAAGTRVHGPPEHLIVDHARHGTPELLTAIGPKLTTSRVVAEQLLDIVCDRLGRPADGCVTDVRPLAGAPPMDVEAAIAHALAADNAGLPDDVVTHLLHAYGADYTRLIDSVRDTPSLGHRVEAGAPVIEAQFRHAVLHEMAVRSEDLVNRRTELGATAYATPHALAAAARALAST